MRKTIGWATLLLFWMGGLLRAQACDPSAAAWQTQGKAPTILALIIGSGDQFSATTHGGLADLAGRPSFQRSRDLFYAQRLAEAEKELMGLGNHTIPDTTVTQTLKWEYLGLASLLAGKPQEAIGRLETAHGSANASDRCWLHTELLMARYLSRCGMASPLHPHYNSGFYNYLEDSLRWSADEPAAGAYVVALNVVGRMVDFGGPTRPVFLELLGDLLTKEPSRFNANYLSALAYLRAGRLLDEAGRTIMNRKALFALEAPRQREDRFNQYRFTQLQKALDEDLDSAAAQAQRWEAMDAAALAAGKEPYQRLGGRMPEGTVTTGFLETDFGKLPGILARSKAEIEARAAQSRTYAGDVDLKKEVKKDTRFNAFAFFLIATIIAAVVVIWRKLKKASDAR